MTVNDLSILPSAAFNLAVAVGIYIVRWRRKKANLPEPEFKAWHVVIIFNILIQLYLIIMPWYPPAGGQYAGDVSFWYATYAVTGVGMLVNLIFVSTLLLVLTNNSLLACAIYYWLWAFLIPKWRDYSLRQELISLDDGAQSYRLRKIPNPEVSEWDEKHDVTGRLIENHVAEIQVFGKGTRASLD